MNKSSLKVKVGIFSLSMLSMATLIMSPVIGMIVADFPDKGISQVQMILSVANLTGIIAAFLVGRLALSLSKRTMALSGALGTFIFGLCSYFLHGNLTLLIIFSGLIGVSVGFITNVIPGLIAEHFTLEERQGAMGKQVFFVSIGTMFLMFTSGMLGSQQWYNSYFTYIFAGVVFVIASICLPKDTLEREKNAEKHSLTEVLNINIVMVALMGFCFMVLNNAFNNNISLLVTEQGFGSSGISGTLTMIAQLGGLLTGLSVGRIAKITKTHTIILAFIISGISLTILSIAGNIPILIIGSFLSGSSQAMFFSQAPFLVTISVHPILIPMGMAVLSTANSIGGFLSPAIINTLNNVFIGTSAQGTMIVGAILSFVVGVCFGLPRMTKKKPEKI